MTCVYLFPHCAWYLVQNLKLVFSTTLPSMFLFMQALKLLKQNVEDHHVELTGKIDHHGLKVQQISYYS